MSSAAPVLVVCTMEDGGYIVRGSTDVDEARGAVKTFQVRSEDRPWSDVHVPPAHRVGWFRWNPCSPRSCYSGGGHRAHIDYREGPGPGRWRGVYFTH